MAPGEFVLRRSITHRSKEFTPETASGWASALRVLHLSFSVLARVAPIRHSKCSNKTLREATRRADAQPLARLGPDFRDRVDPDQQWIFLVTEVLDGVDHGDAVWQFAFRSAFRPPGP